MILPNAPGRVPQVAFCVSASFRNCDQLTFAIFYLRGLPDVMEIFVRKSGDKSLADQINGGSLAEQMSFCVKLILSHRTNNPRIL